MFFSPIINIIVEKHVVKHKQIKQLVKKKIIQIIIFEDKWLIVAVKTFF